MPSAPQFAQAQLPTEPPTKRRRTNESVSPKRSTNSTLARAEEGISISAVSSESLPERIVAQLERSSAHSCREEKEAAKEDLVTTQSTKPTKKPAKCRRKLCLDDEAKEQERHENGALQAGGLEDTFIFGLKSKQQRPKRKPQVVHLSENPEHTKEPLPPKVKRTTKAIKETENKPISQPVEELPAKLDVLQNAEKAARKKPAAKRRTATTIAKKDQSKDTPEADTMCDNSRKSTSTAAMIIDSTEKKTNVKPEPIKRQSVKAKAAPRKANKRTLDEALANVGDVNAAAPEKASKRPRRQAAISAIEKVTLSYEEDLVPVDKLRRAPELEVKPRRSRKAAVPEGLLVAEHSSAILSVLQENRKCEEVEIAPSEPQPKKRARKKASELNDDKSTESADAVGQQTVEYDSSAREKENGIEANESHLKPPTARRGRKQGAKAAKASAATANVVSAVEDLASVEVNTAQNAPIEPGKHLGENHTAKDPDTSITDPKSKGKASKGTKEAGKDSTAKPPAKTRRALANFDSNIVRRPSAAESKISDQSASPPTKQQSKQPEVEIRSQPQAKPRGRPRKAQPAQQSITSPNDDPPPSTSTTPKKRHKISANEDLDWLFEDHSTRGARPVVAAAAGGGTHLRQPKPKALPRRKETVAASGKEVDLDDLLESIAGFSGKLLTGQRARGVVTK